MLFWVAGIMSIIALAAVLSWHYCRNVDWQIKLATARLNKIICSQRRGEHVPQRLLKNIYTIINKGMDANHSIAIYQALDLLKLAFGYGLVRPGESARLMAVGVRALNANKPDTVSFVIDTFRPLVRQLPPEAIVSAVDQLTLIGVVSLKRKHNFLAAKVVECIFFIMEQTNGAADQKVAVAAIRAFRVIGVLVLRRRDAALFREMNMCLAVWLAANPQADEIAEEAGRALAAWLHRITWLGEVSLFTIMANSTYSLIEANVFTDEGIGLIVDEWGNVAASACLNPMTPLAGLIIEFLFQVANKNNQHWIKVVAVAGRVAKLAIYRHGLIAAFMVIYPMLELGRRLLWSELKFIEYNDEFHNKLLFRVVRECLILLTYAARQNLLGSTGETIVELYKHWAARSEIANNPKSIKKYCQFLLLFWLKNKRQSKRYMPCDSELIEPILFSDIEKQKLGI